MIDVDKTTFEEEVLKAEGYVFVDFYGDGCVPTGTVLFLNFRVFILR